MDQKSVKPLNSQKLISQKLTSQKLTSQALSNFQATLTTGE